MSQFIVGYQKTPDEWVFAGVWNIDPLPTADTPEQSERLGAEQAVKYAALQHEESDAFSAIPADKIHQVRIAYRRRVIGIVQENDAPPAAPDSPV